MTNGKNREGIAIAFKRLTRTYRRMNSTTIKDFPARSNASERRPGVMIDQETARTNCLEPVSYTHLTLPTT